MTRFTLLQLVTAIGAAVPFATAQANVRLFAADNALGNLLEINPQTGAGTIIGPFSHPFVASLAWDSSQRVLYATTSDSMTSLLLRVDPGTGATTSIGPLGTFFFHGLEYDPDDDTLYGVASGSGSPKLYRVSRTTGAAAVIATITGVTGILDIAYDSTNGVMYLAEIGAQRLHRLDLSNGATTLVGPFGAPGMPFPHVGVGMAFDPVLGLLATDNTGSPGNDNPLYRVDTSTGHATLIGFTGSTNVLGLAFVPACLPCDANCDGSVNGFDVDPFVELLTGAAAPCSPCAGDMNGDGSVNGFDIDAFTAALTAGGC
ncbi:MAG: hypothetical protein CHACPFDD_02922 [Phycisphaerae bacterium]|nr:hypothetical protein [Phycisphaerae bacterium]